MSAFFEKNHTAERVYVGLASASPEQPNPNGDVGPDPYKDNQKKRTQDYIDVCKSLDNVGLTTLGNANINGSDAEAYPPGSVNGLKKDAVDYLISNHDSGNNIILKSVWEDCAASVVTLSGKAITGVHSCNSSGQESPEGTHYCSTSGAGTSITVDIYRDQMCAEGYPSIEVVGGAIGFGQRFDAGSGCYYRIGAVENGGLGRGLIIVSAADQDNIKDCVTGGFHLVDGAGSDNKIGTVSLSTANLTSTFETKVDAYHDYCGEAENYLQNSISGIQNYRELKHREQKTLWFMEDADNTAFQVPYDEARVAMQVNKDIIEDNP